MAETMKTTVHTGWKVLCIWRNYDIVEMDTASILRVKEYKSKKPEEADVKVFNVFIKQQTTIAINLTHSV
jgi:hypothetical protein